MTTQIEKCFFLSSSSTFPINPVNEGTVSVHYLTVKTATNVNN